MQFYTDTELGPKQALLPSGALLCSDVVIARTGRQFYHALELPGEVDADDDGMVAVQRDPQEVFDETSMGSFEGAPVTLRHPSDNVGPTNWRSVAVGHAQNVRRVGDTLVADLIVHDRGAIDLICNQAWRSVSCGYDAIEWTDHTFNPWIGCTKISSACDHCYAETWAKRYRQSALWAGDRRRTAVSNWRKPIRWNKLAAEAGTQHKVFCASLADAFDNQVPDVWRASLWELISDTPCLDWLLLTKRPQNIPRMLPSDWGNGWSNVWLGTTVENRVEQRRIAHLRAIPACLRFLCCEPLLEPIAPDLSGIDWVICGGESGGGARFMPPEWAFALLRHCEAAGVPFFMKQMTRKKPIPPELMVRQFPAPLA